MCKRCLWHTSLCEAHLKNIPVCCTKQTVRYLTGKIYEFRHFISTNAGKLFWSCGVVRNLHFYVVSILDSELQMSSIRLIVGRLRNTIVLLATNTIKQATSAPKHLPFCP